MKKLPIIVVLLLITSLEKATGKGYCGKIFKNGKWESVGDCDSKQQSQVLKDLDEKLAARSAPTNAPPVPTASPTSDGTDASLPTACDQVQLSDAKVRNTTGGLFDIYPEWHAGKLEVYCDLVTDGGGWTVFQRRMDGSEDFYRTWNEYANGFGDPDKEFWLGLEKLHQMTKLGDYQLRIDLRDFYENFSYALYGSFSVGSAASGYRLFVSSYSGTAGDSLTNLHTMQFSTKDSDRDTASSTDCAKQHEGSWWYSACTSSNLNGVYGNTSSRTGVYWWSWKSSVEPLKFTEMKFRAATAEDYYDG